MAHDLRFLLRSCEQKGWTLQLPCDSKVLSFRVKDVFVKNVFCCGLKGDKSDNFSWGHGSHILLNYAHILPTLFTPSLFSFTLALSHSLALRGSLSLLILFPLWHILCLSLSQALSTFLHSQFHLMTRQRKKSNFPVFSFLVAFPFWVDSIVSLKKVLFKILPG